MHLGATCWVQLDVNEAGTWRRCTVELRGDRLREPRGADVQAAEPPHSPRRPVAWPPWASATSGVFRRVGPAHKVPPGTKWPSAVRGVDRPGPGELRWAPSASVPAGVFRGEPPAAKELAVGKPAVVRSVARWLAGLKPATPANVAFTRINSAPQWFPGAADILRLRLLLTLGTAMSLRVDWRDVVGSIQGGAIVAAA